MNILILHGSSDLYGASKIVLTTVILLKKRGHSIVVVLSSDGPLAPLLREAGAEVIFIRLGILRRKYMSPKGIINRMLVLTKASGAIKRVIKEKKISLVYSNTTSVLAGAFAARSLSIKHVWHIHEIIERPKWMRRFLGKMVNRYSDIVIVVSEAVKKNWLKYVSAEKIHLIYNGIDYSSYSNASTTLRDELGIDNNTVVIGMIGRVHYWKGQEYFLQIAAELSKRSQNIRFVMIGDVFPGYEYLYHTLAELIRKKELASLVSDLGYRTDIAELLQGFDIFVLPSRLPDPFPTVILEAMASAKPVIATEQGGALEMIEKGITGLFIPVNDPHLASLTVEKLLHDEQLRIRMGKSGREKVLADFSYEAFENKMIKVLE